MLTHVTDPEPGAETNLHVTAIEIPSTGESINADEVEVHIGRGDVGRKALAAGGGIDPGIVRRMVKRQGEVAAVRRSPPGNHMLQAVAS